MGPAYVLCCSVLVYWVIGCLLLVRESDSLLEFLDQDLPKQEQLTALLQVNPNAEMVIKVLVFFTASWVLPVLLPPLWVKLKWRSFRAWWRGDNLHVQAQGLQEAIEALEKSGIELPPNLLKNMQALKRTFEDKGLDVQEVKVDMVEGVPETKIQVTKLPPDHPEE